MINSGAEPKYILTSTTNEENNFFCCLGRILVHDGFKITAFSQGLALSSFSLEQTCECHPGPVRVARKPTENNNKTLVNL